MITGLNQCCKANLDSEYDEFHTHSIHNIRTSKIAANTKPHTFKAIESQLVLDFDNLSKSKAECKLIDLFEAYPNRKYITLDKLVGKRRLYHHFNYLKNIQRDYPTRYKNKVRIASQGIKEEIEDMSELLAKTLRVKKEGLTPISKRVKTEGDSKMASIFSPVKPGSTIKLQIEDLSDTSYEEAMELCK